MGGMAERKESNGNGQSREKLKGMNWREVMKRMIEMTEGAGVIQPPFGTK